MNLNWRENGWKWDYTVKQNCIRDPGTSSSTDPWFGMKSLLLYSFGFWIVIKVKSLSKKGVFVGPTKIFPTHQVQWSIHISCFAHEQKSNHFVGQDLEPKKLSHAGHRIWFNGKMVLTVERALFVNCIIRPAYCTVVELSRVERIGIPEWNYHF